MQRQRVFSRHCAKRHTHDGVGAGGEDVHLAVTDQGAVSACNAVRERKAHTFALADPVFLHQAHFVGPAVERGLVIADLHVVQQFLRVSRDVQVVALPPFDLDQACWEPHRLAD